MPLDSVSSSWILLSQDFKTPKIKPPYTVVAKGSLVRTCIATAGSARTTKRKNSFTATSNLLFIQLVYSVYYLIASFSLNQSIKSFINSTNQEGYFSGGIGGSGSGTTGGGVGSLGGTGTGAAGT